MDLYADTILDHYRHPRFKETIPHPTISHEEKNLSCGDTVTIMLKIDGDRVADLHWTGDGCAISQAAMSILAEEFQGKTLNDLDALTTSDIRTMLGIPIGHRRIKCALLCFHTLKNALHHYRQEPLQTWTETVGNEEKTS